MVFPFAFEDDVLRGLKEKRPGSLVLPGDFASSSQNGTSWVPAASEMVGSLLMPEVVGSPFFAESRK
jgi:hypothetical protein